MANIWLVEFWERNASSGERMVVVVVVLVALDFRSDLSFALRFGCRCGDWFAGILWRLGLISVDCG